MSKELAAVPSPSVAKGKVQRSGRLFFSRVALNPFGFAVLTITAHPHLQALLQPAVLAAVAVVLGDLAVPVAAAGVAELLSDGALEEALAALAADGAVVATWDEMNGKTH